MADETKKLRPEHMGWAAILIAAIGGGGGTAMNISSNTSVSKKLDDVVIGLVKVESALKSNDADKLRIETELREARDDVKALKVEIAEVRQRQAILEAKQK